MNQDRQLFDLVNHLLFELFEREEEHLKKRESQLIRSNTEHGGSADGFRHLGFVYTELEGSMRKMGNYTRPHSSLIPQIDALIEDRKTLQEDKDWVRQGLVLVLRGCQSTQDIRDALPNGLKAFIPGAERLERTRPEAFTLADNQRSYTQYMKLREKIEFYVAARLLY